MLDEIYMRILDMTKTGSIVILVVLLARLLLGNAPKVFSYALWAVVLLRLLCPVSFGQTTVSLLPDIPSTAQDYTLGGEPITILEAGNAAFNAVGDALNGGLGMQIIDTTEVQPDGTHRTVTTDWYDVWILFGQYVWAAGFAGLIIYSSLSYGRLRRKLEEAVPLGENIWLADGIQSPFVVGFIRPKIYLPSSLSEKERSYIILHEQYHIRRYDHIAKLLAFLALCLHWFNPLVWLAFHLASKDMEMSCDEAVVRKLGSDIRADYSASLLTLATGRRIIAGTPLAFGEGDPRSRIRNLAKWKKPALWVMVIAVILCVVLAVCLLTDPAEHGDVGRTYYYGTVIDEKTGVLESDGLERDIVTVDCFDGTERTFWIRDPERLHENWLGKTVKLRGKTEADILFAYEVETAEQVSGSGLEEAIDRAIISHNWSIHDQSGYPCTSFVRLAGQDRGSRITVYGLALYQVYVLRDDVLVEEGGSHVPVALTFHRSDSGAYVLAEYWEPRDGGYYTDDIRAKFPALVTPDTQAHIDKQIQNCYAKAAEHYGLEPGNVISSSATANGFELRLYSEKPSYAAGEEVVLWATLEYKGEGDRVTIWHGAPYITFSLTDGGYFNSGGMVHDILTSTTLEKGQVYRFEYAKSGGFDPASPDAEFWENFYMVEGLQLRAGTYTASVNGLFYLSPDQLPEEKGPSCELQITITE